uniref:Uncharacterized protein n=1 Tax=uncultured marine virus TaxID=186617 RepID=A0A0F7L622_9VIRU|nr:hypothetical protein [uncultured marine virus]
MDNLNFQMWGPFHMHRAVIVMQTEMVPICLVLTIFQTQPQSRAGSLLMTQLTQLKSMATLFSIKYFQPLLRIPSRRFILYIRSYLIQQIKYLSNIELKKMFLLKLPSHGLTQTPLQQQPTYRNTRKEMKFK